MPMLDIKSTRAVVEIHREPLRLKVDSQPARMRVKRTRATFKVNNMKQLRAESGLRSPDLQRRHMQQRSQAKLYEGIQSINSNAQRLTNIQDHQGAEPELVATVTLQNTLQQNIPVLDVGSMPRSLPKLDWDTGSLEIEWDPHRIEMSWEGDMRPQITVTPHSVEIKLIDGRTVHVRESEAKSIESQGYGKRVNENI